MSVSAETPIHATAADGHVHITVDPDTARELAQAWAHFHARFPATAKRVRWHDDVVRILTAAAEASPKPAAAVLRLVGVAR